MKIDIKNPKIALEICRLCNECSFDVDAVSDRIVVDAKSFLALQGLIGRKVDIRPVTGSEEDVAWLFKKLENIWRIS